MSSERNVLLVSFYRLKQEIFHNRTVYWSSRVGHVITPLTVIHAPVVLDKILVVEQEELWKSCGRRVETKMTGCVGRSGRVVVMRRMMKTMSGHQTIPFSINQFR